MSQTSVSLLPIETDVFSYLPSEMINLFSKFCPHFVEQNNVAYVRQIRKEFTKTRRSKMPCVKPPPEKVKVAVRNLSFAINKGEVFGLLGPNGAGKTTALSMMTADVHPTQGKVCNSLVSPGQLP